MSADSLIPAPEPLRRRLAMPGGPRATVSLGVTMPFELDRERFEAAVRTEVARVDAFRLRVAGMADTSSAFVTRGDPPDVRVIWEPRDGMPPISHADATEPPSQRNEIVVRVDRLITGRSTVALHVPARAADRRSLEIVMRRIVATYQAQTTPLASGADVSYFEVAEWLQALIQSVEGARGKLYWRRATHEGALGGAWPDPALVPVEMQRDVPMPPAFVALTADDRSALAAASWLHIARVLTGHRALVLGCLADGRLEEGLGNVVGPLSRLIPLTIADRYVSTREAIRSVGARLAEARQWQELFLFDDFAGEPPRAACFPYGFEYVPAAPAVTRPFEVDESDPDVDQSLVLLRCEERQSGLGVTLRSWHPDVTTSTLAALAERWLGLIERSLACPDRAFGEPDVLTARERQAIPWRGETREADGTIHDVLSGTCARYPDRTAIACMGRETSFAMLESLASGLAAHLPPASAESVIAVEVERSVESIVAILAVLKAGAAVLPLSATLTEARRLALVREAGATLVLGDARWKDRDGRCAVLDLRAALAAIDGTRAPRVTGGTTSWRPKPVHPDQLALVLDASGSGGDRSAVAVSHRAVLNLWTGLDDLIPGLRAPRRVGMNAPISFHSSIAQLIQLLSGHTLVLIPDDIRLVPPAFWRHLAREQVEVIDATPSHLARLLDSATPTAARDLPHTVLLGGEPAADSQWSRLRSALPFTQVYHVYGVTECAGGGLVGPIAATVVAATLESPLCNTEIVLDDRRWRPVPDGVTGEVIISGRGLARGYMGAPARTAERFTPHAFGNGARAFRTGDYAERSSAGSLRHRGRDAGPVRVRGDRVSLEDVRAALEAQPGVATAIAAVRRVRAASASVVAWVVPTVADRSHDVEGLTERTLVRALATVLPQHAVPERVVLLDRMPLTEDGLVDRAALDARLTAAAGDQLEPPRTPLEAHLLAEWQEILDGRATGVDTHFLEAGGDSFSILQLNLRLRRLFGVELPVVDMFRYASIRLLAQHVAGLQSARAIAASPEPA